MSDFITKIRVQLDAKEALSGLSELKKLDAFERLKADVKRAADELLKLKGSLSSMRQQLAGANPGTAEYRDLARNIQDAERRFAALKAVVRDSGATLQGLRGVAGDRLGSDWGWPSFRAQRVTSPRSRITVLGAHAHSFMNPHGLSFHIGCYREAPGVRPVGVSTAEHTWFPGYAWRVVLCAGCGAHLGWVYQREGADRFYGLIVGRLR